MLGPALLDHLTVPACIGISAALELAPATWASWATRPRGTAGQSCDLTPQPRMRR